MSCRAVDCGEIGFYQATFSQMTHYLGELRGILKDFYNLNTFPAFSCHSDIPASFHDWKAAEHI